MIPRWWRRFSQIGEYHPLWKNQMSLWRSIQRQPAQQQVTNLTDQCLAPEQTPSFNTATVMTAQKSERYSGSREGLQDERIPISTRRCHPHSEEGTPERARQKQINRPSEGELKAASKIRTSDHRFYNLKLQVEGDFRLAPPIAPYVPVGYTALHQL